MFSSILKRGALNRVSARGFLTWLRARPSLVLAGTAALAVVVWGFGVWPMWQDNQDVRASLPDREKELVALRTLGGQIRAMEDALTQMPTLDTPGEKETMLKQVERLAEESKVFPMITRIAPTSLRVGGETRKGLVVELDGTNLARLTPFLHALTHRSLLSVEALEMRRGASAGPEGAVTARVTVVENG